jgi:H+/Cl- antiporter ClcA
MFLVNADQMSTSRPGRNLRRFHIAVAKLVPKAVDFWHGGSAWRLGPLLLGQIVVFFVVFFAVQSEYASNVSKMPFTSFPVAQFAQFVSMSAGFALVVFVAARYFPGAASGGILQTIAALNKAASKK